MTPPRPLLRRLDLDVAHQETWADSSASLAEQAMAKEPSGGAVGRVELNHHWERFSVAQRKALLKTAREMARGERGG